MQILAIEIFRGKSEIINPGKKIPNFDSMFDISYTKNIFFN